MRGTTQSGSISSKGNVTSEVFELLTDEHGMGVVCGHHIDYEAATFSDGFMAAIRRGQLPILGSERPSHEAKMDQEYHHMIVDGECMVAYFTPEED